MHVRYVCLCACMRGGQETTLSAIFRHAVHLPRNRSLCGLELTSDLGLQVHTTTAGIFMCMLGLKRGPHAFKADT